MSSTDYTLDYYDKGAAEFVAGTVLVDFSALQNEFTSYVRSGGRILDLGCGSGRDSKAFLNMGYEVVAIDGSRELCRLASKYLGQEVIWSTFQEYEPEGEFDGIWACASLLHLKESDVSWILKKYAKVLKNGGIFYVSFKYGEYEGKRNGRYFIDMNEDSFQSVIQAVTDLSIKRQFISEDARPGRSEEKWLNVFLEKK